MKILNVTFDFPELTARLSSALAKYANVSLMMPRADAEPYERLIDKDVNYIPFEKPRLRQPIRQWSIMRGLVRDIHRLKPDVIHLQKGHLYFNACLPFLRQYPLVVTIHDPEPHLGDVAKTPRWILNYGRRKADRVIAHNEEMKALIVDRLKIPGDRVSVVPHIECGDSSVESQVEERGNEVLFFGRIWQYKGLDYLIKAQPEISKAVPNAKIVIAGQGEDFASYRSAMVDESKFEVHNEFVTEIKQAQLFRRSSVVVLPYVDGTQSGVIPMAYSFGKPVVATRVGGLPSQIDDGETGYLIPPRDSAALAYRVIELLLDDGLRKQMGKSGNEKLQREWSADVVALATLDVHRQIAGREC